MDLDPGEYNPMWAGRAALAGSSHVAHRGRLRTGGAQVLRIALATVHVRALRDASAHHPPAEAQTLVVTWDAPLTMLSDDEDVADALRTHGVPVPVRGGTYAERQWDAREALEEVAHRFYDHGEGVWGVRGMITRQPRYSVAVVDGGRTVRAILAVLPKHTSCGLVVDARVPEDLRVFGVETLDAARALLVRRDGVEEHARDAFVARVLSVLTPEAEPR